MHFDKALEATGLSLKKFFNLENFHLHMFFRNQHLYNSVFGGAEVSTQSSSGRRKISPEDWAKIVKLAQPDSCTSGIEDTFFDEAVGNKRIQRIRKQASDFVETAIKQEISADSIATPMQGGSKESDRLGIFKDFIKYNCGSVDLSAPNSIKNDSKKNLPTNDTNVNVFSTVRNSVRTLESFESNAARLMSVRGNPVEVAVAVLSGVDVVFPTLPCELAETGAYFLCEPVPNSKLLTTVSVEDIPLTSSQVASKRCKLDAAVASPCITVDHGVSCVHFPSRDAVRSLILSAFPDEDCEENIRFVASLLSPTTEEAIAESNRLLQSVPVISAAIPFDRPQDTRDRLTEWSPVLFSKGYVSHLHRTHEMLGATLLFVHNWFVLTTIAHALGEAAAVNRVGQYTRWLIEEIEKSETAAKDINERRLAEMSEHAKKEEEEKARCRVQPDVVVSQE